MKAIIFALCVVFLPVLAGAQDAAPSATIALGERFSLHSEVLNDDRPYWVSLPSSYVETRYAPDRYAVLYLLDGDTYFSPTVGVVQFLSSGASGSIQIPELIIVAVPNTNRTRDLTPTHTLRRPEGDDLALKDSGGGDAFLTFLKDELVPHVDRTYRTKPYRIIVGHSFGGLLVAHAFQRAPETFQGYLAIDPSVFWDEEVVVQRLSKQLQTAEARPRAVYVAVSGSYSSGYLGEAVSNLMNEVKRRAVSGVRLAVGQFDGEIHQSVFLSGLHQGLLSLFDGYKLTPGQMFTAASTLSATFEKLSTRLGVTLRPPERFVDQVGLAFLNAQQYDRSIDLLKFNATGHPTSPHAFYMLAQAYDKKGEVQLAIEKYETALRLNPDNDEARIRVADLRTKAR